jgi:hypothetical protein
MSRRPGINLSSAAHSILKALAKKSGNSTKQEMDRILMACSITPRTVKLVRPLCARRVALSSEVEKIKLAEIEDAGGGVTLSDVADFLLQAGAGRDGGLE